MKKPGWKGPAGFVKNETHWVLVGSAANVAVVAFEAEFGWKFRKAFVHVHIDAVVLSAFFVRGFEGAAVGWAGEGEEFVKAVTKAFEGAVCAVDSTVAPSGFCTVGIGSADHHFRNFNDTVEDVTDGTTELAGRGVMGTRRRLNVSSCEA
jgi:hypothetical protein